MKILPIFVVALATASVATFPLPASAVTFLYSGTITDYETPQAGYYSFTVAGAQGGSHDGIGGGGAIISGDIYFSQGIDLSILVGGAGFPGTGNSASGGGGMSFIAEGSNPVIVA